MFPSNLADPDGYTLSGLDRIMFDVVLTNAAIEEERLAAGDTDGISVEAQARHAFQDLDVTEHEKLQELKQKLREKG